MKQSTKHTLRFFWSHVKAHKWLALVMIFALCLGVAGNLLWVIVFRDFFDLLSSDMAKSVVVAGLLHTLLLLFLLEIVDNIGWRTAQFLNDHFQPRVMADIANECFQYMHKHSYRFFSNNFGGALVKKINRLMRGFEGFADRIYWDMVPLFLKLTVILLVLFSINIKLGLIMALWSGLFIGVNYWASRFKWKYDVESAEMDTKVTASLADSITNAVTVKMFSGLAFEAEKFRKVTDRWFDKTKRAWRVGSYFDLFQGAAMVALEIIILYVAIRLWENDLLSLADFFVIQAYLFEMFHQLWSFGRNLREVYVKLADSEEMIEILNLDHEIKDLPEAKEIRVSRGEVNFEKVNFSYSSDEDSVLEGLSFKVKPGEKIALIGPSGGGKSTIVKLLLRMFDLDGGKILIDGQNIAEVKQDSLRQQVTLVPQDPILFHRTLMENIRYGRRDASDEEVMAAAKLAHCHEFIEKFPKKYHTFVGERGVKLSGGQRQRVAIARAILSNARILVLDEATSSLDSESESLIQDALMKLMKQKTTFIIAHRLSTIMSTDRIFVLDGGQIVEEGNHSQLASKQGGLYKKLWDLQVGGYL